MTHFLNDHKLRQHPPPLQRAELRYPMFELQFGIPGVVGGCTLGLKYLFGVNDEGLLVWSFVLLVTMGAVLFRSRKEVFTMEKKIMIGPYSWNDIPGILSVTIVDIAPNDLASVNHGDPYPVKPHTLGELKQLIGGIQGKMYDGIGSQEFLLDLSPWAHLNENTYLRMVWSHKADQPIPLSDPRHPQHRRVKGDFS